MSKLKEVIVIALTILVVTLTVDHIVPLVGADCEQY